MKLLIGTKNPGKVREYRAMLRDLPYDVVGLADVGLEKMTVAETGSSCAENAEIKAMAYSEASNLLTLADDSGLAVDALNGEPGVHSARYGGAGLDDRGRRLKLLEALDGVPAEQRTARFICAIVVVHPQTLSPVLVRGFCEGQIAEEEGDGSEGFGYDAIFVPNSYNQTFAQLPPDIKNRISHRGEAVRQIVPVLRRLAQV